MCMLADLMDQGSLQRLKLMLLIAFLLMSANVVYLHGNSARTGVDHGLRCVNDYLLTINCSLSIMPSDNNSANWLILTKLDVPEASEDEKCMLSNTNGNYVCSFQRSETLGDTDSFKIFLCRNTSDGSESCELLDDDYMPVQNITPNTPCCLMVTWISNQYLFTWKSSYEKYLPYFYLIRYLMYELHYYKRGHKQKVNLLNAAQMNLSVGKLHFEPDTEYTVRVRSSPNQVYFSGQWSDWSTEVHWRTEPVVNDTEPSTNTLPYLDKRLFIPMCVLGPLLLLLCYASVKKWKQSAFIPTPAPYFQSLYSDCQGDFKSWVVTPNNKADLLKAEETFQIDTMTRSADVQEEDSPSQFHPQLSTSDPASDTSLLGVPHSETPGPQGSMKSLCFSSEPASTLEGDSGCWLCSATSLERDTPWYNNEYCTLSDTVNAFQKFGSVTTEHRGSAMLCLTGIIRTDANRAVQFD